MASEFSTIQLSKRGGRPENEDSALSAQSGKTHCWVMADGLGGHGGGATASRVACAAVIESFRSNLAVTVDALNGHLRTADQAVRQEQVQSGQSGMRTTIVALIANATHAVWGHVGDSRLYHFRAGRILSQTKDHSLPQTLVDAGEISAAEIRHHEDRNRLLRVIGEEGAARPSVVPEPVLLSRGDAFLLCSDGFWENVRELEIELDFAKSNEPSDWLSFMETRLQERVNGSHDNYTAIAVLGDLLPVPLPPQPGVVPPEPTVNDLNSSHNLLRWAVIALLPIILLLSVIATRNLGRAKGIVKPPSPQSPASMSPLPASPDTRNQ